MRLKGELGNGGHGKMGALTGRPVKVRRTAETQEHEAFCDALHRRVASNTSSRDEIPVVEGKYPSGTKHTIETPEKPGRPGPPCQSARAVSAIGVIR